MGYHIKLKQGVNYVYNADASGEPASDNHINYNRFGGGNVMIGHSGENIKQRRIK